MFRVCLQQKTVSQCNVTYCAFTCVCWCLYMCMSMWECKSKCVGANLRDGSGILMKVLYVLSSLCSSMKCFSFLFTTQVNSPCFSSILNTAGRDYRKTHNTQGDGNQWACVFEREKSMWKYKILCFSDCIGSCAAPCWHSCGATGWSGPEQWWISPPPGSGQ